MHLHSFIAGLPKAELHVHHVGSASPRIVSELAARHPDAGVPSDLDGLREFFTFRDFAHFIEVYLAVVDLIRTPEDIRLLTYEVAREMAEGQRLRYAELTCTPYTSVLRGIAIEAYTEAIEDARVAAERDFGLVLRWIYDIPGELGVPGADATLEYALHHAPDALVGFGLGGPEIGVPRPQFQPHFDAARATGLHSVPHAGETTGPETVWDAVRLLGAERIGHGVSAARDPELKAAIQKHATESQEQVSRIERIAGMLNFSPDGVTCQGTVGLIKEATEHLEEFGGTEAGDAAIIASAQKNEHYEIANYGTAATWADTLGYPEAAALLKQTLAEDIKEIYIEVKSAGYDVKAMRMLVKEHMESAEKKAKREEVERNAELMRAALGAFVDSPLGAAAMERAY